MKRKSKPRNRIDYQQLEPRHLLTAFLEFVDPNPNTGNQFGEIVTPLETGNVVVTSPFDDAGGVDAGAVYLFDGATGELISTLTGSTADDRIGLFGILPLEGGNFLIRSPNWDNGAATDVGAITFVNGVTGLSGEINANNSLVGTSTNDDLGSDGIIFLQNGNYLVASPKWDNGLNESAGALTFGDRLTGVSGAVSAANSLVGSSRGDGVGNFGSFFVTELNDSNYVVRIPSWDNGSESDAGAVTFGSGSTGVAGVVSAANSLVGSSEDDSVGGREFTNNFMVLENGNYLVRNRRWDNGSAIDAGAVTFGDASKGGAIGVVGEANSLIGSSTNDFVGASLTLLDDGNYVVTSPHWDNGAVVNVGAATFGSGTTGVKGKISATNSLIGSSAFNAVGSGIGSGQAPVVSLHDGNYAVLSPYWDSDLTSDVGAVTFGDAGLGGAVGVVSAANSLVGSSANDRVGDSGVTEVSNGNYVVASRWWDNGSVADAGAATFLSTTAGLTGVVSEANSLVGSSPDDQVGNAGITPLASGNYVVRSTWLGQRFADRRRCRYVR